jgi:PelA/Pel-15E family pectate lyase
MKPFLLTICVLALPSACSSTQADEAGLREQAVTTLKKAARFYREQVATHGGYVYHYSLDLAQRWGEGRATADQIWVQPPGTPTVGLAYLKAYEATGDRYFLEAATDAALSIAYGQLKSGGWTNLVDFDPNSPDAADYRNGKGHGKNYSSLDDGQTQSAIKLMTHVDQAHAFRNAEIHESAMIALDALLNAQFPNGAFPQVWKGPVEKHPNLRASYPNYDWRTAGRVKNYWDMYTLNDDVCGYAAETLIDAHSIYGDRRYLAALHKLGDFLLLAQMPDPQPAWAQQYNYEMKPIWARKFEPPAIAGDETQEVLETLMMITEATGDRRYLEPIPRALAYLKRSLLDDGRVARFYELQTNKPLYMVRRGKNYTLTHDDSNLPAHYSWKSDSRIDDLEARYDLLSQGNPTTHPDNGISDDQAREIISSLDDHGRWISVSNGERLVGQPKIPLGEKYLSSELFSRNLTLLSEFLVKSSTRDDH